jgi:hypothetical protein
VVCVLADVVEVVVLAAGTDALLRVRRATGRVRTFGLSKKNRDELVHARVREQQIRRIGHERRRRNNGVLLRLEEVEERLSDLRGRHHLKQAKSLMKILHAGERKFFASVLNTPIANCQLRELKFFKKFSLRNFAHRRISASEVAPFFEQKISLPCS